ncbi:hypothetical protein C8R43DRAFT_956096 [Mycena crocata]|nr:hypothetical protein C8R43DRAFT_956096 [Mycena crocata]
MQSSTVSNYQDMSYNGEYVLEENVFLSAYIEYVGQEAENGAEGNVAHDELVALIIQLKSPTLGVIRPQILRFNKIDNKACDHCMDRKQRCKIVAHRMTCDACNKGQRKCSRSTAFGVWVIRSKYRVSNLKATELFDLGQELYRAIQEAEKAGHKTSKAGAAVSDRNHKDTVIGRVADANRVRATRASRLGREIVPSMFEGHSGDRGDVITGSAVAADRARETATLRFGREIIPSRAEEHAGMLARVPSMFEGHSGDRGDVITGSAVAADRARETATSRFGRKIIPSRAEEHAGMLARVTLTEQRVNALEVMLRSFDVDASVNDSILKFVDFAIIQLQRSNDVEEAVAHLRLVKSLLSPFAGCGISSKIIR